jgi:hypothetical protein
MSHAFVRSSEFPLRNSPRNFGGAKPRFDAMKNRFPTLHRNSWRQRFVAIAREAHDAGRLPVVADLAPRRAVDPAARAEIRVRFAALTH